MSDFTLSALMTRVETVLEATPFFLKKTTVPFDHDAQPNGTVENTYTYRDGGLVRSQSMTNHQQLRVDRVEVFFARKLAFNGHVQLKALEDEIVRAERYLIADGLATGYHVTVDGSARRVSRPKGKDLLIGSSAFLFDYNFNESV